MTVGAVTRVRGDHGGGFVLGGSRRWKELGRFRLLRDLG